MAVNNIENVPDVLKFAFQKGNDNTSKSICNAMGEENKPSSYIDEENSRKRRGNGKTLSWEYI